MSGICPKTKNYYLTLLVSSEDNFGPLKLARELAKQTKTLVEIRACGTKELIGIAQMDGNICLPAKKT